MKKSPQERWTERLVAILDVKWQEMAQLAGHTEDLVPDVELWSKMNVVGTALRQAKEEAERVLRAEQEKRGHSA